MSSGFRYRMTRIIFSVENMPNSSSRLRETLFAFLFATFGIKFHCNRAEVFLVVGLFSDHNLLAGESMHVTSHVMPFKTKRESLIQLLLLLKAQRGIKVLMVSK